MATNRPISAQRMNISGFTLLEVIVVLVLISIFTVLAISRRSTSDASLIAQTQVLASHLRFAQMRAMNTDSKWGIVYYPNSGYYQLYKDTRGNVAQLPGEDGDRVALGAVGITLSSAIGSNPTHQYFEIRFDSWGGFDVTIAGSGSGSLSLRLTKPGYTAQDLLVTKNTGFIP